MNNRENRRFVKSADANVRPVDRIREIHAINRTAKSAQETDRAFSRAAYQMKAAKLDLAHADGIVRFAAVVLEASETDRWHLPLRELTPRLLRELINKLAALEKLATPKPEPAKEAQPHAKGELIILPPTKPPQSRRW